MPDQVRHDGKGTFINRLYLFVSLCIKDRDIDDLLSDRLGYHYYAKKDGEPSEWSKKRANPHDNRK
ncbi:MAG: hypothetical protein FJ115_05630 [Deltaproteobacteria bacterium]|nr:hypothetical protein [Deltaproteobacteria bacterium]MBM4347285.1 hypothetical protein [Deltaproteobacteria bacterium]